MERKPETVVFLRYPDGQRTEEVVPPGEGVSVPRTTFMLRYHAALQPDAQSADATDPERTGMPYGAYHAYAMEGADAERDGEPSRVMNPAEYAHFMRHAPIELVRILRREMQWGDAEEAS